VAEQYPAPFYEPFTTLAWLAMPMSANRPIISRRSAW
jgi:hypothetical protein